MYSSTLVCNLWFVNIRSLCFAFVPDAAQTHASACQRCISTNFELAASNLPTSNLPTRTPNRVTMDPFKRDPKERSNTSVASNVRM